MAIVKPSKPQISQNSRKNVKEAKLQSTETDITFPIEVWELIADLGDLKYLTMMQINKVFLHTFAPKLYDTLHLTIVISTLTKMKLNDKNFLKHGFDSMYRSDGSYSIYKRNKINSSSDYEFLDTEIYEEEIFDDEPDYKNWYKDVKSPYLSNRNNSSIEVRSLEKIKFILKNIVQNPTSIMKGFIKEVLVDICVLDKFDEFFGKESESKISQLTKVSEDCGERSVLKVGGVPLGVLSVDDNFQRNRWKDNEEVERKYRRFFLYIVRRYAEPLFDIFPKTVYFKELLIVYLLSNVTFSTRLRRGLMNFKDEETFKQVNPIVNWYQKLWLHLRHVEEDIPELLKLIFKAQLSVVVKNRKFEHKENVDTFLHNIVETFTTDKYDLNIRGSVLIAGIKNSQPQLSQEFTRRSIYSSNFETSAMLRYKPEMILINKC